MDRYPFILGCLLGTALGDAVGLRREGLSPQRAARMYGEGPLKPNLIFGFGLCSDDTEHTQMIGRALVLSGGDTAAFEREFARQLRCWLLSVPAGVGLATLRACLRLLVGISPARSGVYSAGNGPAMRSALFGVWAESDQQLRDLVQCSTRITHSDPKAEEGALLVAQAARICVSRPEIKPSEFLSRSIDTIEGNELRELIRAAVLALAEQKTPVDFAESQGWSNGVSGYVNHTVPAAMYCWAYSPNDFKLSVENAVLMGGDTDSVAAITGAICGANVGSDELPTEWLEDLAEWPRSNEWMKSLARTLSECADGRQLAPPSMYWPATLLRNILFATLVLSLGFRRLLPPY